ncbi:MAG TPA: hypothetical protein VLF94_03420 [Chlamydiales bacterium]|nr:hypothetical protein [Chlamydiales bacterium]
MKRFCLALLVSLGLFFVVFLRTDGFSPRLIKGPLLAEQAPPLTPEIEAILSQPFHYLNKGRQCFVFASADGKYVLKLFNQKYLQTPWYAFFTPEEKVKRMTRRHYYENSYEIAYRQFGEGIDYLHLGPSDRPLPILALTDRAHRQHAIDLNSVPFVLQKRGIPFYSGLEAIYQKEGLAGLCREIDAYVEGIEKRIAKQIADGDRDVEHNWGYVDGQIFHLDPGRLYYDETLVQPARLQLEWRNATRNFHKWLKKNYPEGDKYLEKRSLKTICATVG